MASFKASMHGPVSSVVESRHAKTFRLQPVENGDEIDEATGHRDIGDIHRLDLVRTGHDKLSQQIGIDLVAGCQFRRVRPAIQGPDAPPLHAGGHVQPSGGEAFLPEKALHHPAACEQKVHVKRVDPAHQFQVISADRARLIVQAAPADPEQISLTREAQLVVTMGLSLRSPTDRPWRALLPKNHCPASVGQSSRATI